ncbi:gliding motility-associated C-terminal domain-containing protein [Tenacibaculum pacificus]|uniref:T9SS type B sorting domain-containing protein n=1 Tax=Tenacibaculum pacificus TaxID=3018314 RepID=UPI0022F3C29A|nr:gliding motility-associated C-terminal domain-containing protein [Tenacibaculum pacificus]WBX74745.1 gliding motility-associated C-terminal domain-containing protein [Tenacibaculum pacificus]
MKFNLMYILALFSLQILSAQEDVFISKEIANNPANCKQFDVTLTIKGTPPEAPQEVVLLIDVSGSMQHPVDDGTGNTKPIMDFAKDAARDFVAKLLSPINNPTGKNKISIVSYNYDATILTTLTSNQAVLEATINNLLPTTGTNMQDALLKAGEVFSNSKGNNTFKCKTTRSIVLLTDGVPNSYNNPPSSVYCPSVAIDTDCQRQAISAAKEVETTTVKGVTYNQSIFTVGFRGTLNPDEKNSSKYTLDNIQNSGAFYTDNAADLTSIYSTILGQLIPAAVSLPGEPLVKDIVADAYQIIPGSLTSSSTLDIDKGTGSFVNNTINWEIDKVLNETLTLKYSILATDPNYCGNVTQSVSTLKYINSDCIETTKVFDNPDICIPCPVKNIEINREKCLNSINYSFSLSGDSCGGVTGTYLWNFFLNNVLVGTSSTGDGVFNYTGSDDFTGDFRAELEYGSVYPAIGCTLSSGKEEKSIALADPIKVVELINNTKCYNGNDGSIELTVSGGYGDYLYNWSNGSRTKDISNLGAGDYTVVITDKQGCSFNEKYTINSPDELSLSLLGSDLSCGGIDGGIDLSVTGGTGNYSYLWSNGAITQDINNLSTGLYTVTVTDANDCEKSISTTLISLDNEVPVIIVPDALLIETCNQNNITSVNARYKFSLTEVLVNIVDFNTIGYSVSDDTNIVAITYKDEIISYNGCITKVLRTFKVTDACGKIGIDTLIITIEDTIKPSFTVPSDITISTDTNCTFDVSVIATGDVTDESDNCDTTLDATFTDVEIAGTCDGSKVITRIWSLSDACGNTTTKDQTITIEDTIKPTFTVPSDITISTDTNCTFDVSVIVTGDVTDESDNCDTTLDATFTDVETAGSCDGSKVITRTWSLSDACGNTTTKDQVITIEDTIKPTFTVPSDITISTDTNCTFDVSVIATGDVTDESDNCDTTLDATFTDVETAGSCDGSKVITRTWSLSDACGNTTTKDQTITIEDTIKPTFTVPSDITISTDTNCTFDVSVIVTGDVTDESDNCDTTLDATFTDVETAGSCDGSKVITRTWSLSDACGNTTTKDQTITIEDTIKPTFTVPSDITISTDTNCTFDVSVIVTGDVTDESDNCDTTLDATFTDVETAGSCDGSKVITRTWSLSDACGNTTTKDQVITIEDTIKPSFTVPSDITISTDTNCTFDVSVIATGDVTDESDNCDTTLDATFTDVETAGSCDGSKVITRTWSLSDACGNTTTKDQTITIEDTIKPTFTVPSDITISTDTNCTFDVSVIVTGDVTDESDNCDTTLDATFTDVETAGSCDGSKVITRTWSLSDACGNTTTKDQVITIEDTIKPSFTVPSDITISTDTNCTFDVSVIATGDVTDESDNCDTTLDATFTDVETAGTCDGSKVITRTWSLSDACGNTTTKDQVITIEDTIKPSFTVPSDITISTDTNCTFDVSVIATGDVTDESDNCDTTLDATFTDIETAGTCDGSKVITRTWSLSDACGNTTTKDQVITIEDTIKPSFTVPSDITISTDTNCTFDVSVIATGDVTDESDNCDTTLDATFTDVETAGSCDGSKVITRTWSLSDACGNTTTKDQVITIEDTIKPSFTVPSDITISTDTNCTFDVSVIATGDVTDESDNCDTTLDATFTDIETAGTCDGSKVITRTWSLSDACGNTTTKDQVITIEDTIKPSFTVPSDITISTDTNCTFDVSVIATGDVTDESDNCDTTLDATFTDIETAGTCDGSKVITRTWSLSDACGNTTTKDQVITIEDTIKPSFTVPSDITISTDTNCTFDVSVIATGDVTDESDNCDTTLDATFTDVETAGSCDGSKVITRTWSLSDACGNTTTKDQVITIEDTIKPSFTVPSDITISTDTNCTFDVSVIATGDVTDESDNCDTTLDATFTDIETAGTCDGSKVITRTWSLSDACGNTTTKDQVITIEDTIKPSFTVPSDITISTDTNCTFDVSVIATGDVTDESDNCDTTLDATFTDIETAGTCDGSKVITRTWSLSDACGNTTTKDQVITIEDTIKPSFTVPSDITISTDTNCTFDVSVIATGDVTDESDNCDTTLDATFTDVETAGSCEGSKVITRTWSLSDACGNTTTKDQVITIEDTIKPSFTVPSDITISTDTNCTFDVSVIATGDVTDESDNCDTTLDATFTDVETAGTCDGSKVITRTWSLSDACGNTTTKDQVITIEDTIKPSFTVPSDITISTDTNCTFDVSVIATGDVTDESDNCDTTLDATFTDVETVGSCDGSKVITRTWSLSDACGNTTTKDQVITIEDTIKPSFTVPSDITISTDTNCTFDVSVIATGDVTDESDNCDTTLDATFTDVETAGSCEGSKVITRTWSLSDACGNTTTKDQVITIEDTIKPSFTVPSDITISTDTNCTFDVSVIATGDVTDESDNCDTTLDATFTDVETAGTCDGSKVITRTWSLSDACGNTTTKDQTITIEDTIKPTFTVPSDITISTDTNCTFDVSVIKTGDVTDESDNCDTTLDATFTDVETAGTCDGSKVITRTWSLSDACGNTTTKDQTITIEDTIKPTFTVPSDITISTDTNCTFDVSVIATGDVTDESDNCDTTLDATFTDVETAGTCDGSKVITRTWSLSDACGNTTTKDQTITIEDTIKPSFTVPSDITISTDTNCTFDVSVIKTGDVTDESDNCDTTLDATFTDVETAGSCDGSKVITRTWSLSDACGSTTTKDQTITIEDTIKPTFTVPSDITISTDTNCTFDVSVIKTGDVTDESDNCDTTLDATFTDVETVGSCDGSKVITRTWSLSDACGNTTTKDQTITIEDTIKPTFTVPSDITISTETNCTFDVSVIKTGDVTDESDNCDTTLDATFTDVETAGTCDGSKVITRTWSLSDACGNTTTKDQTIIIEDTIKPSFIGELPQDITVSCDEVPEVGILLVSDNCSLSSDLELVYTENITRIPNQCDSEYKIIRTWNLKDCAGNTSSHTQKIMVIDDDVPELVTDINDINDINVVCDNIPEVPTLEFTDNCSSNNIKVEFEEDNTFDGTGNDYLIKRNWIATDSCGNTTSFTQNINVTVNKNTSVIEDSRCIDDGEIDLNDYLVDSNISLSKGKWTLVKGDNLSLSNGVFDPLNLSLGDYIFNYTVSNDFCILVTQVIININDECIVLPRGKDDIKISKAVTPNGDSLNEYFKVAGAESCGFRVSVKIFNRWGGRVYKSSNYTNNWNGVSEGLTFGSGEKLPAGTYYYIVILENSGLKPFTGAIYLATK